eukprot:CAMPEP_0175079562 /NCGR_PEP_ID=MMETSP0052_2-20121109/24895_1 /TAXON_ID=51329 ORGANISM="Polytomella parva, Strain SAG 63-3" /NCGR_SAMPLE_ID=MMETSP0052_2 /ASSEMBLY_ACC=CAM_ASM_000194 /LENGTH=738 /DNA_ID=CAMNT_0016349913 /DNA_START=138 /DNA_END=2355 /DNA_ORIENTATION=+
MTGSSYCFLPSNPMLSVANTSISNSSQGSFLPVDMAPGNVLSPQTYNQLQQQHYYQQVASPSATHTDTIADSIQANSPSSTVTLSTTANTPRYLPNGKSPSLFSSLKSMEDAEKVAKKEAKKEAKRREVERKALEKREKKDLKEWLKQQQKKEKEANVTRDRDIHPTTLSSTLVSPHPNPYPNSGPTRPSPFAQSLTNSKAKAPSFLADLFASIKGGGKPHPALNEKGEETLLLNNSSIMSSNTSNDCGRNGSSGNNDGDGGGVGGEGREGKEGEIRGEKGGIEGGEKEASSGMGKDAVLNQDPSSSLPSSLHQLSSSSLPLKEKSRSFTKPPPITIPPVQKVYFPSGSNSIALLSQKPCAEGGGGHAESGDGREMAREREGKEGEERESINEGEEGKGEEERAKGERENGEEKNNRGKERISKTEESIRRRQMINTTPTDTSEAMYHKRPSQFVSDPRDDATSTANGGMHDATTPKSKSGKVKDAYPLPPLPYSRPPAPLASAFSSSSTSCSDANAKGRDPNAPAKFEGIAESRSLEATLTGSSSITLNPPSLFLSPLCSSALSQPSINYLPPSSCSSSFIPLPSDSTSPCPPSFASLPLPPSASPTLLMPPPPFSASPLPASQPPPTTPKTPPSTPSPPLTPPPLLTPPHLAHPPSLSSSLFSSSSPTLNSDSLPPLLPSFSPKLPEHGSMTRPLLAAFTPVLDSTADSKVKAKTNTSTKPKTNFKADTEMLSHPL